MASIIKENGNIRKLSWVRDLPDPRDFKYRVDAPIALPEKVDLRKNYGLIFDQDTLGSCTGNAISMGIDFVRVKENLKPIVPSRLFIYYNERVIENSVKSDSGAMIRDGIKSVANTGYCSEKKWPYRINKFATKPSPASYLEAKKQLVKSYRKLQNTNITELKTCLAQGYGFVFGFSIFDSFQTEEVSSTGKVPMPDLSKETLLGGHAVFAVGYDDTLQCFIIRNSWSSNWGDEGHFYLPYEYITHPNLAADFWTITIC